MAVRDDFFRCQAIRRAGTAQEIRGDCSQSCTIPPGKKHRDGRFPIIYAGFAPAGGKKKPVVILLDTHDTIFFSLPATRVHDIGPVTDRDKPDHLTMQTARDLWLRPMHSVPKNTSHLQTHRRRGTRSTPKRSCKEHSESDEDEAAAVTSSDSDTPQPEPHKPTKPRRRQKENRPKQAPVRKAEKKPARTRPAKQEPEEAAEQEVTPTSHSHAQSELPVVHRVQIEFIQKSVRKHHCTFFSVL